MISRMISSPGRQSIMVAESPIIRVCSLAGVALSVGGGGGIQDGGIP